MPPDRHPPGDSREWLNRARSNLAYAQTILPETYLEDACFNAQQAAEKAVKAVLIQNTVDFPYVHDLGELLALVKAQGLGVPIEVSEAERLTRYAVVTRYPGVVGPVSTEDHKVAVTCADAVVRWAEALIQP